MPDIAWQPDHQKPGNATEIEVAVDKVAPGGIVRMTLVERGWRVRALLPAAVCARGAPASDRDVSEKVAEVLAEYDCPVSDK